MRFCDISGRIRVSGRIAKQDVDTLRNVIEDETSAIAMDLENVDLVDREAVKFLARRDSTELYSETALRISANGSREREQK